MSLMKFDDLRILSARFGNHLLNFRTHPSASAAATMLALLLSGCIAVGPDYQPPEPTVPAQWQGAAASGAQDAAVLAQWWRQFDDPVLDGLIDDALAANTDLKTAQAQLRQARAQRNLVRAGLGPTVTVSGSAARNNSSGETGGGTRSELYGAGFDASWEPDVFGGVRRSLEAANANLQASEESLRDTRVSLVAEVALNYVELRTAEQRLAIAEDSLAEQYETYALTRWRWQAGLVSELDAIQARTLLDQTRAALPTLRTAIVEARYRLAILLGLAPGALDARLQSTGTVPVAAENITVGIPADTLRQRPDVRAAERRLAAQTAQLGAAEAARYPSFKLSGSVGVEALALHRLWSGNASRNSLLAGITAPIFDSGSIRSNIAVQDALLEQARLGYESAVLTALQDVENALISLTNTRQRQEDLAQAEASAKLAWQLAQQQYAAGLADFQSVLDTQRTLLNVEDQLSNSSGEYSSAQIQLYKALGGGWTSEAESAPAKEPS